MVPQIHKDPIFWNIISQFSYWSLLKFSLNRQNHGKNQYTVLLTQVFMADLLYLFFKFEIHAMKVTNYDPNTTLLNILILQKSSHCSKSSSSFMILKHILIVHLLILLQNIKSIIKIMKLIKQDTHLFN